MLNILGIIQFSVCSFYPCIFLQKKKEKIQCYMPIMSDV